MAEGYPARIRIQTPTFLTYIAGVNTIESNYTTTSTMNIYPNGSSPVSNLLGLSAGAVAWNKGYIDIEFADGITYADYINLNFSLSVDPNKELPVGMGIKNSSIMITPICKRSEFDNPADSPNKYPLAGEDFVACGPIMPIDFRLDVSECYDLIPIHYDCQVRAETQRSPATIPSNAVKDPSLGLVWSPAIRTGAVRNEYLEFDFLAKARINRIRVGTPSDYRIARRVMIQVGHGPESYYDVKESYIYGPGEISFDSPIIARYMRLVILQEDNGPHAPNEVALGING